MNEKSIVVIPAFNEEKTVKGVVKKCSVYCDVLVVDDGSTDETAVAAALGGAAVLHNDGNKGYEYSLNLAYTYAIQHKYDVMITMDADGQLPSEMIPKFLKAINTGAAVVVGNRIVKPRVCEKILAFVARNFTCIHDPYCGMKAYCLNPPIQTEFSQYNSVGTSLALSYIEAGLPCENIEVRVTNRVGKSKFGGKFSSEYRLFFSMVVGSTRILKNWVNL